MANPSDTTNMAFKQFEELVRNGDFTDKELASLKEVVLRSAQQTAISPAAFRQLEEQIADAARMDIFTPQWMIGHAHGGMKRMVHTNKLTTCVNCKRENKEMAAPARRSVLTMVGHGAHDDHDREDDHDGDRRDRRIDKNQKSLWRAIYDICAAVNNTLMKYDMPLYCITSMSNMLRFPDSEENPVSFQDGMFLQHQRPGGDYGPVDRRPRVVESSRKRGLNPAQSEGPGARRLGCSASKSRDWGVMITWANRSSLGRTAIITGIPHMWKPESGTSISCMYISLAMNRFKPFPTTTTNTTVGSVVYIVTLLDSDSGRELRKALHNLPSHVSKERTEKEVGDATLPEHRRDTDENSPSIAELTVLTVSYASARLCLSVWSSLLLSIPKTAP
ncbi:hypothetical protein B0A55_01142 [Friedmanniomyces simplex]|uniref:Uncharacterized protein n=1 Tax=Friedmanniomyces simplex TaxID=329884 RepID=A0A4U0XYH7_9PEZI|nr:hypothetical protein B0A55_01142 [Friedmanniomyces simplex]